jgi:hypothetical protein
MRIEQTARPVQESATIGPEIAATETAFGPKWTDTSGEMKHRLFMAVLVIAIVLAMTGWVYALGWVVLKLI